MVLVQVCQHTPKSQKEERVPSWPEITVVGVLVMGCCDSYQGAGLLGAPKLLNREL